jgi:hypothetical protein
MCYNNGYSDSDWWRTIRRHGTNRGHAGRQERGDLAHLPITFLLPEGGPEESNLRHEVAPAGSRRPVTTDAGMSGNAETKDARGNNPNLIITRPAGGGLIRPGGTGGTHPPAPGMVETPDWLGFGHELCGHAVWKHSFKRPIPDDNLTVDIENDI